MKHYAIYGEIADPENLPAQLFKVMPEAELSDLRGKQGAVFSNAELEKHLEDDHRHGRSKLVNSGRSLCSLSAGERRKALLNYLLDQQPDFLILDNPFDSLDRESVEDLKLQLEKLSKEIQVILLYHRQEDLLPFIDEVFRIKSGKAIRHSKAGFHPEDTSRVDLSQLQSLPPPPVCFKKQPEVLVKLEQVSVRYEDRPILSNISWEVKKGEFWKLSGPNGAGKTTLLSMIYGDNPKAYGENIFLFGNRKGSGETVWEIKRKIGYFSPNLTEFFTRRNTVLEMIISGLLDSVGLYQKPSRQQVVCAEEWLKLLKMEDLQKKIFVDLPLLEQREVLIARAMIKHPPLLILDEPTTGLNDESALTITGLVNSIARNSDTAIIYVSHREEKGLMPERELSLIPGEKGSRGEISSF
ncbi:ATP-binding cassette domain-containing protein [Christiangramia crocea]|uniref:ATP-binding cassette domain-containing protein n=1 Tax=Christiangramia crocea TaxID=2904124 RepID=A0A9X2A9Z5_9FLAO|nr:ATP-binding cassette domain-containing protein [Gramella crocea]MCG9973383.1 ATP-binding cassette domain-containing protein [Gramella crocea]